MEALVVDDSSLMRKVVERALRGTGLPFSEILQAGSGAEALELMRARPSLRRILTDINMPGMDGLELLEQRAAGGLAPNAVAIMLTTEVAEPQVLRAIAAGAQGYLCKPFTPDQVRTRILPLLQDTMER